MSDTITIQLDPLDTLFFKDGKPFSMGEETWADGIFPPPPSVLYGMLRTQYLSMNPAVSIENVIEKTDGLEITQIYYRFLNDVEKHSRARSSSTCYLPIPADVVERNPKKPQGSESEEDYVKILQLIDRRERRVKSYEVTKIPVCQLANDIGSSAKDEIVFPYWKEEGAQAEAIEGGFLEENDLRSYLIDSEANRLLAKRLSDFLIVEPKTGIKRNRETRTTSDDGDLYRVGMRRADGFQIEVSFSPLEGLNFFQTGHDHLTPVRLGAEGKVSAAKIKSDDLLGTFNGIKSDFFRVYLATPAIILNKDGLPIKPDLEFLGIPVTYLGAAIKKAQMIGGFDMKNRQPKPMYKVVPAGSVFYFKADEVIDFNPFQGRKISDVGAMEGFGIAYFGKLTIETL